ncbi:DUF2513 domain-containing protein [Aquibacillus rhizosphaerae]|uniref:DUF2513 domain-containing protein n=1 Tax=Aquibacillus rhizosphaerae TaxID=3051431 RepID=A0ABT7LBY8_9BACI|nr:DUF2513 domain-containing protein [Aquibacillus sp. LR5S19]MDL4842797.1 DUF2513 domain-containing protein [Aquibacillus sp. LR5S19]
MELNPDVLRETLFTIEEQPYGTEKKIEQFVKANRLKTFDPYAVAYCCEKLLEEGFINGTFRVTKSGKILIIEDLTYPGHELLEIVRNDTIWNKIKKKSSKVVPLTLPALLKLALEQ